MTRQLVIFCDGTSNKFGTENTNVVRLLEMLQRDDEQLLFYDPGVGTMPGDMVRDKLRTYIDLAFATTLGQNVADAYTWLMRTWQEGDQIFLFGFSRGAYTARVIAAMLHHIGLMPAGLENLIPYAIRLLRSARKDDDAFEIGNKFRATFARATASDRRVPTHFLGVWDTVSSVGWFWDPVKFRYSATNPSVAIIRHAIALDERRAFYRQNRMFKATPTQDLQQVWFAGAHADVGGGYADASQLWRCGLDWMLSEAKSAGGLRINDALVQQTYPAIDAWREEQHKSLKGVWNLAELFPKLHFVDAKPPQKGHNEMRANLYRSRTIKEGELIHETVLKRLRGRRDYDPANLTRAFKDRVRTLPNVPTTLPYEP